jgi:hypothetical protein
MLKTDLGIFRLGARLGLGSALSDSLPKFRITKGRPQKKAFYHKLGWAESNHTGPEWWRREAAINRLNDAVGRGDLRPSVRFPDGAMVQLTAAEWWRSAFRRDMIIGGEWCDSAGGLVEFNGLPILLDEDAFDAWRRKEQPISADAVPQRAKTSDDAPTSAPAAEPHQSAEAPGDTQSRNVGRPTEEPKIKKRIEELIELLKNDSQAKTKKQDSYGGRHTKLAEAEPQDRHEDEGAQGSDDEKEALAARMALSVKLGAKLLI